MKTFRELLGKDESKEARMLRYLRARKNKWCNGWDMVMYVKTLHHTQLIKNLRKDHNIINKREYKNGTTHTFYKLIED